MFHIQKISFLKKVRIFFLKVEIAVQLFIKKIKSPENSSYKIYHNSLSSFWIYPFYIHFRNHITLKKNFKRHNIIMCVPYSKYLSFVQLEKRFRKKNVDARARPSGNHNCVLVEISTEVFPLKVMGCWFSTYSNAQYISILCAQFIPFIEYKID